jgi:hypothetical protein
MPQAESVTAVAIGVLTVDCVECSGLVRAFLHPSGIIAGLASVSSRRQRTLRDVLFARVLPIPYLGRQFRETASANWVPACRSGSLSGK